jgi:hypothetical protein
MGDRVTKPLAFSTFCSDAGLVSAGIVDPPGSVVPPVARLMPGSA